MAVVLRRSVSHYVAIAVLGGHVMIASCATLLTPTSHQSVDLPPRDTSMDWLGDRLAETTSDPRVEDNVIWGY